MKSTTRNHYYFTYFITGYGINKNQNVLGVNIKVYSIIHSKKIAQCKLLYTVKVDKHIICYLAYLVYILRMGREINKLTTK